MSSVDGNDLQNDFFDDVEPVSHEDFERVIKVQGYFVRFGDRELVGHGSVTNIHCAEFKNFRGCVNVGSHSIVGLNGVNYHNKVAFERVFSSCNKPSCPLCYKRGWAIREAGKIEGRLKVSSKTWGLIEHVVVSPSPKDYGLSFQALRSKAVKAMFVRGIVGGVLLYHPARYDDVRHWYYSPHFHCIGHILGGYGCRGCVKVCDGCNEFEARTRREYVKDGFIVKVLGKRKTVFGTAFYQLHHSGIKVGAKRANVACWFGVCSYRKLKVTVEKRKHLCPICNEEFVRLLCLCDKASVPKGRGVLFDDMFDADGSPRYCAARGGYGG